MDIAEIQHAIEGLPKEQQAALAAWIAERDQADWDAEIERDFSAGGERSEGHSGKAASALPSSRRG